MRHIGDKVTLLVFSLVVYPVGRFLLEFLRVDASQVAGINANQAVMLVIFIVSGACLAWRHRPRPQAQAAATEDHKPM